MKKTITVFVNNNIYPPSFGFINRALSMVKAFKSLGYQVHLLSSENTSAESWSKESIAIMKSNWVQDINIYPLTLRDYRYRRLLKILHKKIFQKTIPTLSSFYTPPGMRKWFEQELERIQPCAILINYARYGVLLNHKKHPSVNRMIDTIDLMAMNLTMQRVLREKIPPKPIHPDDVESAILNQNFFKEYPIHPDPAEFKIFDRYTNTIVISQEEAELIAKKTKKTRVSFIPMMHEIPAIENSFSAPPLFPTGPNIFNLQGLLFFIRNVLPLVKRNIPDFILQVSGSLDHRTVIPVDGIKFLGFVDSLSPYFQCCAFVISPVFSGTGQQIKIIEAMAYGLPVIAIKEAADRSPIEHGINGLIAYNASEFAEHVCRLWKDRNLCRFLGENARQKIRSEYSDTRLVEELSKILIK